MDRGRRLLLLLVALVALAFAGPAAASQGMLVGAAEDAGKTADPAVAQAQMDLAKLAGLDAIRVTAVWAPGESEPDADTLAALQTAATAAQTDDIRLIVSVMSYGSATTPLTDEDQADFASYATALVTGLPTVQDFIIGNEPNLNRYWMPQFGPGKKDAAAVAYERLLATTYDAMKAVSPTVDVIGGSVSPRGTDNPSVRPTHSPSTFIPDLGAAYRASGRTEPIMDAFAFHPYGESSRIGPDFQHPRSTSIGLADYRKLVGLLSRAFKGTAQPGASLPILYDEYGVQSQIPFLEQSAYTNLYVPSGRDAVTESLQGSYYRLAIQMAACQPTVMGLLIFHTVDESDLDRWQSGMFYADGTPKSDMPVIKATAEQAETSSVNCAALKKSGKRR
jgi:hypothetical protein